MMKPVHRILVMVVALCAQAAPALADEMFQPTATLHAERKRGQYELRVVTTVPDACHVAGAVKRGPPPTVRLTADVEPVRVLIRARRGPCAQVVSSVNHKLRHLKLGRGKTKVVVFAMFEGKVAGTTSVDVPVPPTPGTPAITTADWSAWVNTMPPGPAAFHVTGTVNLPSAGYDAKLVYAAPQGINPRQLILDLVVTPKKGGVHAQAVTPVTVRYDKSPYDGLYQSVMIRKPDGDLQLDVGEAQ